MDGSPALDSVHFLQLYLQGLSYQTIQDILYKQGVKRKPGGLYIIGQLHIFQSVLNTVCLKDTWGMGPFDEGDANNKCPIVLR
jgi:hypothetical protein